ncbi:MAG TPA: ROK family protein [Bryobacterales bacterium]|jgi:glucokinase|nr:ROK family protein [Bryobacterales bacterium]
MDVLAIDIGGTKHSLALFRDARLLRRESYPTDAAGGRSWMLDHLFRLFPKWLRSSAGLAACGVGFGGPVDFALQRVSRSMHSGGWENFALAGAIEKELGIPCWMDNDANLGALGEHRFGAGRGAGSLVYITLSTGIGAGILVDGKMVRGADSLAGELGHVLLKEDGPLCSCGSRGCLEALCSGQAIERSAGRPAAELLADSTFRPVYVSWLARGLRVPLLLLNPDRIIVGGGISKAGSAFFDDVRAELRRQMPASLPVRIDLRPAALGDDSVLWGARELARENLKQ